jgi:hypothetical protein
VTTTGIVVDNIRFESVSQQIYVSPKHLDVRRFGGLK